MDKRITTLYESAGVDVDSFEHRMRLAWNKASYARRAKYLAMFAEFRPLQYKRWDQLPGHTRASISRIVRQRQQEKQRANKTD